MAEQDDQLLGCCALLSIAHAEFEIAKMAVTERARGTGIGRRLLTAAIERARALGATRLYLETNSSLGSAVHLYESLGFVHVPPERVKVSPYTRSNVHMELLLQ